LILPGGEGTRGAISDAERLEAIRSLSQRTRRTCPACSGSFVLAAAGLLKGRSATPHWRRSETFRRAFPETNLQAGRT
jgi:transcriptional regulator GlxA family with amidase domain